MMVEIMDKKDDKDSSANKAIKALTELARSEPRYKQILERVTQ